MTTERPNNPTAEVPPAAAAEPTGWVAGAIGWCLANRLVVVLATAGIVLAALMVAPFDFGLPLPRDPVGVDAIPDIGENQQIVFTAWPGRSPRDVDDQVTYPLTTQLLAMKGVRTVRGTSMFGFSSIYVIFDESSEFYESRTRLLEKLSSLPPGLLPQGVRPRLGPEATALGQVFWYTLQGIDPDTGRPVGGWDLQELRAIQDWQVRLALMSAGGVAEVASVGGYVREYQVDVDPAAMRAYGVKLDDVQKAIRAANVDVGARTLEVNRVEYFVRGVGFLRGLGDLQSAVVAVRDNTPIRLEQVATVAFGPADRRGALDVAGSEAVGGVVVTQFGSNPREVIDNVKRRIDQLAPALPRRTLEDGTVSKVTLVPFYDRTELIDETLGTLSAALWQEVLITVVVVVLLAMHLRTSGLLALLLPLAVGMAFIAMRLFGVQANVVALAGIAIAIGTIVDMGIVICENILRHAETAPAGQSPRTTVRRATAEVGSAVLTAVLTTVVGFLPVLTMTGAEGKLFRPLALTKTFALIASIVLSLLVLPVAAELLLFRRRRAKAPAPPAPRRPGRRWLGVTINLLVAAGVGVLLTVAWRPLGLGAPLLASAVFVFGIVGGLIGGFYLFQLAYPYILGWCLRQKAIFLSIPAVMLVLAGCIWLGFGTVFAPVPAAVGAAGGDANWVTGRRLWWAGQRAFPGLGSQFMPPLDEGSYLYMPTIMVHGSIGQAIEVLAAQDRAIAAIPEVEQVVGKIGRVESPLDPAPISMIETVITYKDEFTTDPNGRRVRQWRGGIETPDDIWREIQQAGQMPGVTPAPKLQPIAARRVMLQTGMRSPMGVKLRGADQATLQRAALEVERILATVDGVDAESIFAERTVAKPYLVIDPRPAEGVQPKSHYGLNTADVLAAMQMAVGGRTVTTAFEGRERFDVRLRYPRELRDDPEALARVLVDTPTGPPVPLEEVADIRHEVGPAVLKSEDAFAVGYVTFEPVPGAGEVQVAEAVGRRLGRAVADGELPEGVSFELAGEYENAVRARKTLAVVLPAALGVIFVLLYLQFRSASVALMVFSGIAVAFAGGFGLLWLYGQEWFLNVDLFGQNLRSLLGVGPVALSTAVWVGFLALFGIATDDGVVMGTYLEQVFQRRRPGDRRAIHEAVIAAGRRRVRPCLMTTATTLLALLPVLTARGRGSDLMVPMAIPVFGGMAVELLTMLVVPVLYSLRREAALAGRGDSVSER